MSEQVAPIQTALILRTCAADMTSHGGFRWPDSGPVEAPDFVASMRCGHGLHGLLWGEGSVQYLDLSPDAKWLVFRAALDDIQHGEDDLRDKCKARKGVVEYCGDRDGAIAYLLTNGAVGRKVVFGTATAGYSGTATAGDSGTATAGDSGTATAGDLGTATAGDSGTATAGDSGTATAGVGGTIVILRWNGRRYKSCIAQVKDEDGDGTLEPNVRYRLKDAGKFVPAEAPCPNE